MRGARRLAEADIIVWAASLVDPECIREHAREDAELIDSSLITHEDVIEVYRRALRNHKRVARVHSGDPALWGAVQELMGQCLSGEPSGRRIGYVCWLREDPREALTFNMAAGTVVRGAVEVRSVMLKRLIKLRDSGPLAPVALTAHLITSNHLRSE